MKKRNKNKFITKQKEFNKKSIASTLYNKLLEKMLERLINKNNTCSLCNKSTDAIHYLEISFVLNNRSNLEKILRKRFNDDIYDNVRFNLDMYETAKSADAIGNDSFYKKDTYEREEIFFNHVNKIISEKAINTDGEEIIDNAIKNFIDLIYDIHVRPPCINHLNACISCKKTITDE